MKAAVLPALGIGDALLMMIASHQLKMSGYHVTTFHHALPELSSWFPQHQIECTPQTLESFDLILVENDNSLKIKQLTENHRPHLSLFYPTYSAHKHAPLSPLDRAFDKDLPMADNIAKAIASLLQIPVSSKNNGLVAPTHLSFRKEKRRVLLHPTSREIGKNWKACGFLTVAKKLKQKGFDPLFCVSPEERNDWLWIEEQGLTLANAPTLSDLAALIYESGFVIGNDSLAGHLASNMNIPTITIAGDEKRMRLWRPGWLKGQLVLPPPYLPNWKFLRLREKRWQHFISPSKVASTLFQMAESNSK